MATKDDEEERLRSAALQNAQSILAARRRAEEALRKQSEWLRVTLASIGDAVISTDAEGRVTFMNGVAESLTGWLQAEALGHRLTDIFHIVNEQSRQPVENPALRALREGKIVGLANHTLLIAKDGSERPIDDSAAPIRDEQGGVVGVVLVFRDITARWMAERAKAEQGRLTALRADTNAALVSTDEPQAALQQCTEAFVQHLEVAFARIWTLNEADNVLELQASAGQYTHLDGPHSRIRVGEFKIGVIASSRQSHLTNAVPDDPGTSDREWAKREGLVAFAGHPLVANDRVLGVVAMFARRPFSDEVLTDLAPLAKSIGQYLDRRRTQVALRESEARKTAILNTALDCIITCDHEGKIIEFNPAAERTFGYRRDDVMYREMSDIVVPPSLRQRHQHGMARFMKTRQSRILGERLVMTGLRADGSEFPVEFSVTEIPTGGPPLFTAYLRDITDRKQAEDKMRENEQRLRFVLDSMPQKIFTATPSGDVDYFNPIWMEYTGLSFEQIKDWGWTQFIHPDDVAENVRVWQQSIDTGEEFVFEHRFRRANGEYRWHISRALPMRDAAGRIVMWIGSNTDIHDVKEADRRKDEFLATLAHELRNPLAPVRNAVQVLRMKGPAVPELQWARDVIDRQMQGMTRLIDDLMDVSRINRNKLELCKERVELAKVVQGAVETSRPVIEEMGHELTVKLPPEPITLDADLTRLAQVFLNLLNNAAKYTEKGGRIDLMAERQGSDVVVSVKDTGIGIPAANLPTIFEMFSQVEGALSRSQGGLGIGLCLVKRLVEMHGGSIEAHSEGPGQGSKFTVRLPIALAQRHTATSGDDTGRPTPTSKLRILVVDDSRDAASSLAMLLKIMGNNLRTAHDGEEAVQAAGEFRPHVVLLDIGLPKMNGYDVCRHIRQQPWGKHMVLIAVTGWGQEDDKRKSEEAGFDRHMVKPVAPQALMTLLAELQPVLSEQSAAPPDRDLNESGPVQRFGTSGQS